MRSLATELKSAVLQILTDTVGFNNLTDDDFAMVNVIGTYGDNRSNIPKAREYLDKLVADRRNTNGATGPDMKRADDNLSATFPLRSGPVGEPGVKGTPGGPGGPVGEVLPTQAPQAAEDQAKLPLAPVDRGPEPQDASSLLDTTAPEIDPSDPPPDYTQLSTAPARQIDG